MKRTKKRNRTIWLVLIVIITLVFGFYFYFSGQFGRQVVASVITAIPDGEASVDEIKRADITVVSLDGTSSWKTFSDTDAHISFKYPSTWSAPVKSGFGTRYSFDFKNGLLVEAGQFYNRNATKVLTIPDLVDGLTTENPHLTTVQIKVGGKIAISVKYDQTKIFIPNRSATDIIVVTNKNNVISDSVLRVFVGTIVSK